MSTTPDTTVPASPDHVSRVFDCVRDFAVAVVAAYGAYRALKSALSSLRPTPTLH